MAPNCTSCHFIVHCHALTRKKKKKPVSLKNVLEETVIIINAIKLWPLWIYFFNILCKDIGTKHEALQLHTDIIVTHSKNTHTIVWAISWTSCFFHGIPFLLERMTERQTMVIQTWIFGKKKTPDSIYWWW